ncbi:MAG: hypothetical protein GF331_17015, partial [Chitinivibrionales bacterium]|nr:hypothetical protein [Chitinivibrionales bacterium]
MNQLLFARRLLVATTLTGLSAVATWAWESALFPRGDQGHERATVIRDSLDFKLPDFSYAGYMAGETALPDAQVVVSLSPRDGDNAGYINDAIARVARRRPDKDGVRGAILLDPGTFPIRSEIVIETSGIVIRGSGTDQTFIYVDREQFARREAIKVTGPASMDWLKYAPGSGRVRLRVDAPAGATELLVEPGHDFAAGDTVIIRQMPSEAFSRAHGADGRELWPAGNDHTAPRQCRILGTVAGDTLRFVEPLRYDMLACYDAHVFRTRFVSQIGLEQFSIGFKRGLDTENNGATHRSTAIKFSDALNCWVRDVSSYQRDTGSVHLQSYGITMRSCKWLTIRDCTMQDPQNRNVGGNGYLFNPVGCDDVLIENCRAIGGRHNFTIHYSSSGCVITGCYSERSRSDLHQYLAAENLFDNHTLAGDSTTAGNRGDKSQGAWWCSTRATFWNIKGRGALYLNSYGRGFLVGCAPDVRIGTGTTNKLQD